MDLGLNGKVALVAAASKGLGKAAALALAQEGVSVAICARGEEALNAAADELRAAGAPDVLAIAADMSNGADVERVLQTTLDHYGQVDILLTNNGGPSAGYFGDFGDDAWDAAVDQLLMSTIRLIRGVLPGMQASKWGRIICVTSIAAVQPVDNLLLSNAVRAGVHGLAKTLSMQYGVDGITINCICPNSIYTDRIDNLAKARSETEGISFDAALALFSQKSVLKRMGRPDEFGGTVAFLASQQAGYITGVSLRIDGGSYAALL